MFQVFYKKKVCRINRHRATSFRAAHILAIARVMSCICGSAHLKQSFMDFGKQNVITAVYTKLVCMWMQAYLLMKTDQEGVELPLGEGLLEHAQLVWIESCKNIRVSGLHRDVARVLTSMGLSHTIEQLTDDSLFSVDIALAGTT